MKMKQKMFIMLAVLLSVSLFTACSDDDDSPEDILKAELKALAGDYGEGSDAVLNLKYNDKTVSGKSAEFKISSSYIGTIVLNDVIPGEETTSLRVDFTPETKASSHSFDGENKNSQRTINYEGSIKEGELAISLDVTFEEVLFTNDGSLKLNLLYSDSVMLGGGVSFLPTGDSYGTITLHNIIPGEDETELDITWTVDDDGLYAFNEKSTTAGRTINYVGTIGSTEMNLALNVEFPAHDIMGKWELAQTPVHMVWVAEADGIFEIEFGATMLASTISQYISPLLQTVLKSIELGTDGGVVAEYSDAGAEVIEFKPCSPNLAHYYVKDEKLYALLNVEMIMAEVTKSNSGLGALESLIAQGIPVNYSLNPDESLTVFIDYAFIQGVLDMLSQTSLWELLPIVKQLVIESMIDIYGSKEEAEKALDGIIEIWQHTTKFEIGLNLVK